MCRACKRAWLRKRHLCPPGSTGRPRSHSWLHISGEERISLPKCALCLQPALTPESGKGAPTNLFKRKVLRPPAGIRAEEALLPFPLVVGCFWLRGCLRAPEAKKVAEASGFLKSVARIWRSEKYDRSEINPRKACGQGTKRFCSELFPGVYFLFLFKAYFFLLFCECLVAVFLYSPDVRTGKSCVLDEARYSY